MVHCDSTHLYSQNRTSNIVPATGPEGEMTKEDVSEPVEGDTVLGCHTRLSSHQRPVIHQVASAPMPSDYGEDPHTHAHIQFIHPGRCVTFQAY